MNESNVSAGDTGTTDTNADGNGGKSGSGEVVTALIAAAVALLVAGVKALGSSLTGDRSIVASISNNTDVILTLSGSQHDHGAFSAGPPVTIEPHTAAGFSSENHGLVGTQGTVTYGGSDGGESFTFGWDNPRLGANSASASKTGAQKSRFLVGLSAGSGNSSAPMNYYIFLHPDYSIRNSLAGKGDVSQGLRQIGGNAPNVSIRDLVDF